MREITKYLRDHGYGCVDDSYYSHINLWQQWYKGRVASVHNYLQYNGRRKVRRVRKTLGLAKTVAEDWANLLLNEQTKITMKTPEEQAFVDHVLKENKFWNRGNQLLELAFALGTGAFVEYTDENGAIKIDYVRAGMIYPLSWDNGRITECAFASVRKQGKREIVYLNIHRWDEERKDEYVIENHTFERSKGGTMREIPLPEDVEAEVKTGSVPRFQIVTPNVANNIGPDCPLGISIYANALDQLEGTDLVYDSYVNEFRLGKKRITVPITMARIEMEKDGVATPVFDDSDTEFYAVPGDETGENKIQEHNMEIRAEDHDSGMQTMLNLVSWKCGFGTHRYRFVDGQLKTATEVVSNNSDLYRNVKKHELNLEDALLGLIAAITAINGTYTDEVSVIFDDSVIEDSSAQREKDRQDVRDGLMMVYEYRMKWYGEDEATARQKAAELAQEGPGLTFGG